MLPAESRENPLLKKGNSDAFFREKCLTKNKDAAGICRVVIACGRVDLRKGIDGFAMIIGDKYGQNPFEQGTLFLFCGQRSDPHKGPVVAGYRLPAFV